MNILRFPKKLTLDDSNRRVEHVERQRHPDDLELARQLADAIAKRMDPEWREFVAEEQAKRVSMTLSWPRAAHPSLRHANGGHYVVAEQKEFRQQVAHLMLAEHLKPLRGHLKLTISACPPDNRRRDIGNLAKQVEDALQHAGVLVEDSQIDDIQVLRTPSPGASAGSIKVIIEKL